MAKTKDLKQSCAVEIERRMLRTLLDKMNEFYEDPANHKAYEEWARSPEGIACSARCKG